MRLSASSRSRIETTLLVLLESVLHRTLMYDYSFHRRSGFLYFLFFVGALPLIIPCVTNSLQLSAVVNDSGDLPSRENSTPQLTFASNVWTYMTSHIVGIYPAAIVIIVNTQRSYIPPSDFTLTTIYVSSTSESGDLEAGDDGPQANRTERDSGSRAAIGTVYDIPAHELCKVHQSRSTFEDQAANFIPGVDTPALELSDKPYDPIELHMP